MDLLEQYTGSNVRTSTKHSRLEKNDDDTFGRSKPVLNGTAELPQSQVPMSNEEVIAHEEAATPLIGNVRKSIESYNKPLEKAVITGNIRAADWARGNSDDGRRVSDPGRGWNPDRLENWRINGKHLVAEKLGSSSARRTTGGNDATKSSYLEEKRRNIAERREKALLTRSNAETGSSRRVGQGRATGSSLKTGVVDSGSTLSTLEEKRKKAAEARARAMAARGGHRSREITLPYKHATQSERSLEGTYSQAEQNPQSRNGLVTLDGHDTPTLPSTIRDDASLSRDATLVGPMVQEAERLAITIKQQEKRLENLCHSLLRLAQGSTQQDLPLHDLWTNVSQQQWFRRHSVDPEVTSSVTMSSSSTTTITDHATIQLSPLAATFLAMDGPLGGDLCRVLNSIQRQTDGACTFSSLGQHWGQLSTLSGDPQSLRIHNRLDELLATCLQANLVIITGSRLL